MQTDKHRAQAVHDAPSVPAVLAGLQPAFMHRGTGESHLALDEYGVPTYFYSFNGLPDEWIVEWDSKGCPVALHPDVIPGYWRDARFIDLEKLSRMPLDS